jgi:hypothetical protein
VWRKTRRKRQVSRHSRRWWRKCHFQKRDIRFGSCRQKTGRSGSLYVGSRPAVGSAVKVVYEPKAWNLLVDENCFLTIIETKLQAVGVASSLIVTHMSRVIL